MPICASEKQGSSQIARKGNRPRACLRTANSTLNVGRGVPQSDKEAAKWYQKAADQGLANAQYNLDNIYSACQGVPRIDKETAEWTKKVADGECKVAMKALGALGPTQTQKQFDFFSVA